MVLNSVYSAEQAKTISSLGFYVIGMNTSVDDEAAVSFATGLYIGLGAGKSVELAFDDALIMLLAQYPQEANKPEIWKDGERIPLQQNVDLCQSKDKKSFLISLKSAFHIG